MAIDKKIAFLGGGNMAEALIKGLLSAEAAKSDQMLVTDASADRLAYLKKTYGHHPDEQQGGGAEAGIVVLCVKPQVIDTGAGRDRSRCRRIRSS